MANTPCTHTFFCIQSKQTHYVINEAVLCEHRRYDVVLFWLKNFGVSVVSTVDRVQNVVGFVTDVTVAVDVVVIIIVNVASVQWISSAFLSPAASCLPRSFVFASYIECVCVCVYIRVCFAVAVVKKQSE